MGNHLAAQPQGLTAIRRPGGVALEAVGQIKQMIIDGNLSAGEKMPTERELAVQLGVSRPTVREAIRALAALRIVDSVQGAGTYVTSLEPELLVEPIDFLLRANDAALLDLFEARVVLEAGLARLAGDRRTDQDLDALRRTISAHEANLHNAEVALDLDLRFHNEVAGAARSPILASLLGSIAALGRASRARTGKSLHVRERTHHDHQRILDALLLQDASGAEQAMIAHLEHVRNSVAPE